MRTQQGLLFFNSVDYFTRARRSTCSWHCQFHYNILNNIQNHSTSSRNRNRGNRGNMGNIKSRHRGSDFVFYSLIRALQNEWLFLRASARTLLNFHCVRVAISYQLLVALLLFTCHSLFCRQRYRHRNFSPQPGRLTISHGNLNNWTWCSGNSSGAQAHWLFTAGLASITRVCWSQ